MDPTQIIYALFATVILIVIGMFFYLYKSLSTMDRLQRQAIQEIGKRSKETVDRLDRKLSENTELFESKLTALKDNIEKTNGKTYTTLTSGFKEISTHVQQMIENSGRAQTSVRDSFTSLEELFSNLSQKIQQNLETLQVSLAETGQENVHAVEKTLQETTFALEQLHKEVVNVDDRVRRLATLEELEEPH